ncbi:hypothetical protein C6Y62_04185 [Hyphomicrobium sulfonivorans]|nr:hypothetical protein [Hyphomicrobium sulfonivorans]
MRIVLSKREAFARRKLQQESSLNGAWHSKYEKNDDFTQHMRLNAHALAFNLQFRVNKMFELAHDFFSSSDSD